MTTTKTLTLTVVAAATTLCLAHMCPTPVDAVIKRADSPPCGTDQLEDPPGDNTGCVGEADDLYVCYTNEDNWNQNTYVCNLNLFGTCTSCSLTNTFHTQAKDGYNSNAICGG